jgi:hypothetical protein
MDNSEDQVTLVPIYSIEYRECSLCGATTIVTSHHMTGSDIEVDPLPHPEGHIEVEFRTGRSKVIPIKQMKNHPDLWRPHIATCPALKNSRSD